MFRGCHGAKSDWHAKLGARADPQRFEFGESKGSSGQAGLVVASQLQISKNLKCRGPDLQNWKRIHFRWWGRGDIKSVVMGGEI